MRQATHDGCWLRFKKFITDGIEHTLRPVGPELPEGVEFMDGTFMVRCCVCDEWHELPVSPGEIPAEGEKFYCGGSPRCCP